ncbi:MAG TPA: serine/threonine-protein kinase, partial [Planctomycetota bacterium]|nr:serine/threonine-protein kinase [Planctomycetota bacterium]
MNLDDHGKAFLQLCVSKRLIEPKQASDLWLNAQRTAEAPQRLVERMGLLASHTITSLENELRDTQEPRTIAGFRTIELLGRGGMASVYLAEQLSLGRQVALKIMAPHVAADAVGTERFLREARIAATVNHRNVIGIIDVGYADGCLYMALELVTGGDAARLAERFGGALPEARALELMLDCANGLQALFEARLVHRDIKPSNIFIGSDGVAKLGDLGLARTEDGADRLTHTGLLIGTPAFMSPEQAGSGEAIDIRSDIYSLGATLFTLVTGRPPFTGSNPIAIAAKALTEPVPDPRSLIPSLTSTTAKLIQRTLQKSPAQRFQTPRELIEAIRQALTSVATQPPDNSDPLMNHPPTATTISTSKPRRTMPRRGQRSNYRGSLVIVIMLFIGGVALTWLLTTSRTKTPEQPRESAAVTVSPVAASTPAPKAALPGPTPMLISKPT